MSLGPYVVAAAVVLTPAAWAIHLAVAPDPFATDSAAVIAVGLVIYGLIASFGLLLARARWAVRTAIAVIAAGLALAVLTSPSPWYVVALALSAASIVGLTGPWLTGWIRRLPGVAGPGPAAMFLALGTPALVPAVGIAAPSGLDPAHGVLGGGAILLAWGYSRAQLWALWGLRVALPVLVVPSLVASPWPGAIFLGVTVAALVAVAWTRGALLAVTPLLDRLPGPRVSSPGARDDRA
jgi:hypothetical protein